MVIAGDAGAFEELYRRTASIVHAAARRVLWSDEDANEVVAEVFVFIWRHAQRFENARGSVTGWLGIVARRRAIDVLRKQITTVSIDDERYQEMAESLAAATPTPDEGAALVQDATGVHAALSELAPLRQKIIVQAFFRGLTHAEIAASMCMSLGTVKSHVRRGLAAMRKSLSEAAALPVN